MRKSVLLIAVSVILASSLSADVREERDIRYADGKRCVLDLRLPVKTKPFPVVVWFHGGGHKNARFVELPYCNHGRAHRAALPYLEMFVLGRLPGAL